MKCDRLVILAFAVLLAPATLVACADATSERATRQGEVVPEWVVTYNGPGDSTDSVQDMMLDDQGHVYVTGYSRGIETDDDYATLKYDTDGSLLWVARYSAPGRLRDQGHALAVDGAGNVYVTGTAEGSGLIGSSGDFATVKYNSQGVQQWVAKYSGPGDGYDTVKAIGLDEAGNIYVAGYSDGGPTADDCVTVKYDANGNELWLARYNGPEDGDDHAWALAVDASGNVYVTGSTYPSSEVRGSNTRGEYLTVKYNTDGEEQWVTTYGDRGMRDDSSSALAVDGAGQVYVTGYISSAAGSGPYKNYGTVKYDADGNQLWSAGYNGPGDGADWARGVAVDEAGNVYVSGYSDYLVDKGANYTTIKYDAEGNELWVAHYSGPGHRSFSGSDYNDYVRDLALDAHGNVYVTGDSRGDDTDYDWATVKYSPDGVQQWLYRYDSADHSYDSASDVAVDSLGNVYVAGFAGDADYTIIKYPQDDFQREP